MISAVRVHGSGGGRSTHLENVIVDEALCDGDLLRDDHDFPQLLVRYIMQLLPVV